MDRSDVLHDLRRQEVVEAAEALFEERAELEISMADIARAAGVSRSTLYNHFATREDVLAACVTAKQERLVSQVKAAVGGEDGAVEQLTALLAAATDAVHGSPAFFRLMQQLLSRPPQESRRAAAEMAMLAIELSGVVRSVLQLGRDQGVLAFADLDSAESLVFAVLIGELYRRSFNSRDPDPTATRRLVDQLVAGLRSST